MQDDAVIGFHRRLYPFQIKRMDWRQHNILQQRYGLPAPRLLSLPPVPDLPDDAAKPQIDPLPIPYINPDMIVHTNGQTPVIDLFKRGHRADHLN